MVWLKKPSMLTFVWGPICLQSNQTDIYGLFDTIIHVRRKAKQTIVESLITEIYIDCSRAEKTMKRTFLSRKNIFLIDSLSCKFGFCLFEVDFVGDALVFKKCMFKIAFDTFFCCYIISDKPLECSIFICFKNLNTYTILIFKMYNRKIPFQLINTSTMYNYI